MWLGFPGGVMDYKVKVLKTETEKQTFQQKAYQFIDVLFPMKYLDAGKTYGIFHVETGALVGGFAVITKGPFRTVDSIPSGSATSLSSIALKFLSAEVTGLWLSPECRKGEVSFLLWSRIFVALFSSKKLFFFYAYSLKKKRLGSMYSIIRPKVVFSGRTKQLPGMNSADDESIERMNLLYVFLLPLVGPWFFLKRLPLFQRQTYETKANNVEDLATLTE
jgi:hypothetical protein